MKQQNRIDKTKSGFLFVLFKRIRSTYVPVSKASNPDKQNITEPHKIPPKFSQQSAIFVYIFWH